MGKPSGLENRQSVNSRLASPTLAPSAVGAVVLRWLARFDSCSCSGSGDLVDWDHAGTKPLGRRGKKAG